MWLLFPAVTCFARRSGGSHTTNTIVITPYGPQTVQTKTKKSMGIIELLLLIVIGVVAVLSLSLYLMAS